MRETPVYLFTGFLEAGTTAFIQETLEDPRMESDEKTMVLVCEEGEEEYVPDVVDLDAVKPATTEKCNC